MVFPDTVKESFAKIKEQEPELLVRFIAEQCVNCCLAGETIHAGIVIARALGDITTAYVAAARRALFGTCCGTHANNIEKSLARRLFYSPNQEQYEALVVYCVCHRNDPDPLEKADPAMLALLQELLKLRRNPRLRSSVVPFLESVNCDT